MTEGKATILVVEDNTQMLEANARILIKAGYNVLKAETLATAWENLQKHAPDAVVLDILLPDGNGLDFIQKIRKISDVPVLLVTSLGSKDERLKGLKAGGDDYIVKPFDLEELAARVNAFLRREAMHREKPVCDITKGSLKLDTVANRAYLLGEDMQLTPKEFSMLLFLVQNEGKTISTKKLYEDVWRMPMAGDGHPIKNTVYRLRKKLEAGKSSYVITSTRGEGYRFEKA